MGKESISPYGFCSAPKDCRKSANSRTSAKRSQSEISPPNCLLRGEITDTTIASYQLPSDTFEIRPDFFKNNGKERAKNVPISGIDDKRSITAIFSITMEKKNSPNAVDIQGKDESEPPENSFSKWILFES